MNFGTSYRHALLASAVAIVASASPALAQSRAFNVPAQAAAQGIPAFAEQADMQILIAEADTRGRKTSAVRGAMSVAAGLRQLLAGTGLAILSNDGRTITLGARPPAGAAGNGGGPDQTATQTDAEDSDQDIIVTAQKREERIQDVPIAISVFSAKALDEQKIEGGSELLRGTPNVNFSKTNFASYNFSIRGIGTKALSVTTDPAVAISFNSMPMVRNRLFEQEYFDVERIEVLRGPQGTLYGRNATAGVVNMIPVLAEPGVFERSLKLEAGNFGSMRASGMVNLPLGETLAIRAAGAWTKRDGYDFNIITNRNVNGRDLWAGRGSLVWEPDSRFKMSLVWEHFQEDDDRSRTGKQLCHTDPDRADVDGVIVDYRNRGWLNQGCQPGSLYDDAAFGVPNGSGLPVIFGLGAGSSGALGYDPNDTTPEQIIYAIQPGSDPFSGITQSRNLREIATTFDPRFRAKNDIVQLNVDIDVSESVKLVSQTGWTRDDYWSAQDYGRFQSQPVFNSTDGLYQFGFTEPATSLTPGGVFCDPQVGCSDGFLALDLVRAKSRQWSQEFRLQSSFDSPLNFNLGVNYLDFKIDEDYFVFSNFFTLAGTLLFNKIDGGYDFGGPILTSCPLGQTEADLNTCVYIDPNPIDSINGEGHNYFRSRNVARTKSWAGFGELYWQAADNLKVTAGLRFTRDIKTTTPYLSQTLLTPGFLGAGFINSGYPASPDIKQKWGEFTGRLVVDWKPDLGFTEDSLIYASFARGYKAGGTNSPGIALNPDHYGLFPVDPRFKPEFVNAFELGMKNSISNHLTLNATVFFYDYKDYQVSQLIDRSTKNENFDAQSWGLELESIWAPTSRLRFNMNLGLLDTKIAKGEESLDVTNRTQGHDDWMVVKPWFQQASNCVAPRELVSAAMANLYDYSTLIGTPGDSQAIFLPLAGLCPLSGPWAGLGFLGLNYDPLTYPDVGQHQGQGFYTDLSGNELPNAPHWTFNLGGQYTLPLSDWDLTLRGDYYRQGASWARVYNAVNDRLKSWDNANLAITLERTDAGFAAQLYVKNLFNKTPITDTFINSDDSGLSTNIFTLDPRIIGFSLSKKF